MRAPVLAAALLALGLSQAHAQTAATVDPGSLLEAGSSKRAATSGVSPVTVRPASGPAQGYLVPDASMPRRSLASGSVASQKRARGTPTP